MSKRVTVDATNFQAADDETTATTNYGGSIHVGNKTDVDIQIMCHGNDRGDDECFWPTTAAVLHALGLVSHDIEPDPDGWEEFDEAMRHRIYCQDTFDVYVKDGEPVIEEPKPKEVDLHRHEVQHAFRKSTFLNELASRLCREITKAQKREGTTGSIEFKELTGKVVLGIESLQFSFLAIDDMQNEMELILVIDVGDGKAWLSNGFNREGPVAELRWDVKIQV